MEPLAQSSGVARSIEKRFWLKVRRGSANDCWEWQGNRSARGYGRLRSGSSPHGSFLAHRVSWNLHFGPIPFGKCVCHRCDNPCCVRPNHLFLGSACDNIRDAMRKGRLAHGERNGQHRLTASQVRDIRASCRLGIPQKVLIAKYGVTSSTVSRIANGLRWKESAAGDM